MKGDIATAPAKTGDVIIRAVTPGDLSSVIELDRLVSGESKADYWREIFADLETDNNHGLTLLVAESEGRIVGFITGEVRAFEFGSEACGWVFALNVDPRQRVKSVGTRLFDTLCEQFHRAGVGKVRTMLARDNQLILAFFRSLGMMAGPFIQLEKDLD